MTYNARTAAPAQDVDADAFGVKGRIASLVLTADTTSGTWRHNLADSILNLIGPAQDKPTYDPELIERMAAVILQQADSDNRKQMRGDGVERSAWSEVVEIARLLPRPTLADRLIGHTTATAEGRQAIVDLVRGEG